MNNHEFEVKENNFTEEQKESLASIELKLVENIFLLIDYIRCIESITGCKTVARPNIDYISLKLQDVKKRCK